ncbi:MAG: Maf family protein [Candidatus Hodarchaeales archaeon]
MTSSFPILVLASNSPARAEILEQINLEFISIPSDIDENIPMDDPKAYVTTLSFKKAETVLARIKSNYDKLIVIGFDTIVIDPKNQVIGKPRDRKHAKKMLTTLSNTSHSVLTGCTIIDYPQNSIFQNVISTEVLFRELNEQEIEFYLLQEEWRGKAGGYAIQGMGRLLIKEIKGDFYNIVGLPISWIWETLFNQFGEELLKVVKKTQQNS